MQYKFVAIDMLNCHKWILRKPRLLQEGYTFTIKQVSISVNIKETNIYAKDDQ